MCNNHSSRSAWRSGRATCHTSSARRDACVDKDDAQRHGQLTHPHPSRNSKAYGSLRRSRVPSPGACESRRRSLLGIVRLSHRAPTDPSASYPAQTAAVSAFRNLHLPVESFSGLEIVFIWDHLYPFATVVACPMGRSCSWFAPQGSTW